MRKALRIILLIAAVILIVLCLLFFIAYLVEQQTHLSHYLSDRGYERALRVTDMEDRDAYIAAYGAPLQVEKRLAYGGPYYHIYETYPGFTLKCAEHASSDGSTFYYLIQVEVWGEQFRFGRRRIGVGSTRAEVEYAYRKDRAIDVSAYPADCDYADAGYDGDWYREILFHYDDGNRVEKITIRNNWKN